MRYALNRMLAGALAVSGIAVATPAAAEVTFYEREDFSGRSFIVQEAVDNLRREGFNDIASSVVVDGPRWARWEVCDDAGFRGRCVTLRPGHYASLYDVGMNNRITSVREVSSSTRSDSYEPLPAAQRDFRRRPGEALWVVDVLDVRAVVDAPYQQRCWIEREALPRGQRSAGGALAGAVLGGILGHQIGGGTGRDLATIGGAIGGAALGSQIGRDEARDVQRCAALSSEARPQFYDVSYEFRGREHHAQLSYVPGETLFVNAAGEPRG